MSKHLCAPTLLVVALLLAGEVGAATYTVNTTDIDLPDTNTALAGCDANPVLLGDQCTLRAAIMQANASTGPHTIVLPLDATITLTLNGIGGAESGDLDITEPMTITGAPNGFPANFNALPRIQANFADRLFDIGQNVDVTFRGLQLTDGDPSGVAGTNGGAIRISASGASVLVDRVRIAENIAATGAGISNSGTLVVEGSDLVANIASTGAAAIQTNASGHTTLRRSSIREIRNTGVTREGLRVLQGGTLIVENSYIDGSQSLLPALPSSGIRADRPALLAVRNATLVDFSERALDLVADGNTTLRVYNSILAGSGQTDCALSTVAGPPPVLAFEWNLVQHNSCGAAVGISNQVGFPAVLGAVEIAANRYFRVRRPLFGSRAIDLGAPADAAGSDPLRLCLSTDIYGTTRPLDGDANGIPRCDIGAVEAGALTSSTYVVNTYDADLVDANPGDDICDANPLASGSQCTLRAAVMEANAKPGPDRIVFGNGPGNRFIALTRAGAGGAELGDLDVSEQLSIDGAGDPQPPSLVSISAVPGDRIFEVVLPPAQAFAVRDVHLNGGSTGAAGGGAVWVNAALAEFERVVFGGNASSAGGGALRAGGELLMIRDSDFVTNDAVTDGSAVFTTTTQTTIERSSFRDNGGAAAVFKGAIGNLVVRDSTFDGNQSGVRAESATLVDIRSSTIAGHTAEGLAVQSGMQPATVHVRATVFADNGDHCSFVGGFGANVMAWNHVDVADAQCAPAGSNASIGDPMLAPLTRREFEGTSWFRVPLHGSPLIDAIPGDAGPLVCAGQDIRGTARPIDSDGNGSARCEIGAVELSLAEAGPRHFIVTQTADINDSRAGDGVCSFAAGTTGCTLRQAIREANALPGPDLISLAPGIGTVTLTIPPAAGDADASGDLRISEGLTLRGVLNAAGDRPTIAAANNDRLFSVLNVTTPVVIEGLRLSGGQTPFSGGALSVVNGSAVTLRQLEIHGHSATTSGGAIEASGSTILIEDSDLHGNHSDGQGAAIRSHASFLEIRRSSIRAHTDGGLGAEQEALHASGDGSTLVRNSTFSGNAGTALRILDGDLELGNVSLVGNSRRGVEFERLTGRNLLIRNTVLAANGLGACSLTGAGNAGLATDGFNLTQGTGCDLHAGTSNLVSTEAGLAELSVTPTEFSAHHPLLPGSALRDAGHPDISALGCTASDQRGTQRPIDGNGDGVARCDIGAIEAAPFVDTMFRNGFE
jgi:hypothetical protein